MDDFDTDHHDAYDADLHARFAEAVASDWEDDDEDVEEPYRVVAPSAPVFVAERLAEPDAQAALAAAGMVARPALQDAARAGLAAADDWPAHVSLQQALDDLAAFPGAALATIKLDTAYDAAASMRHLLGSAECIASSEFQCVDWEGAYTAMTCFPADVVFLRPDGAYVLVDVTSDSRLAGSKGHALQARADALASAFVGVRFLVDVYVVPESIPSPMVFVAGTSGIALDDANAFGFDYVDALAGARVSEAKVAACQFAPARPKAPSGLEPSVLVAAASGDIGASVAVIRAATDHPDYGAMAHAFRRIWSYNVPFTRGVRPPTAGSGALGLPAFFLAVKSAEAGEVLAWDVGDAGPTAYLGRPTKGAVRHVGPAAVAVCRGSGFFDLSVNVDTAPGPLVDLAGRRPQEVQARMADEVVDDAYSFADYYIANDWFMETVMRRTAGLADIEDPTDRARKIAAQRVPNAAGASDVPAPEHTAHVRAADTMAAVSGSWPYRALITARCIASHALGATRAKGGRRGTHRVMTEGDAAIITVAKGTGALENYTAIPCVAFSRGSMAQMSWEHSDQGTHVMTKCVVITTRHVEWYSAAPAAVAAYASSVAEDVVGASASEAAGSCALASIQCRKPFAIALGRVRQLMLSSSSLSSDYQALGEKLLSTWTPMSKVEQVLLSRAVVRSLATAMIFGDERPKETVHLGADGRPVHTYAPILLSSGRATVQSMVNEFYLKALASDSAASPTLAAALCWQAIDADVALYREAVVSQSSNLIYGASKETVAAWRAGELGEFVKTQGHREAELRHADHVAANKSRFACSLYTCYTAAGRVASQAGERILASRVGPQLLTPLSDAMTLKSGQNHAAINTHRSSDTALMTITAWLAGGVDSKKLEANAFEAVATSDEPGHLVCLAIKGLQDEFVANTIPKDHSPEDPRDISVLSPQFRAAQMLTEKVARALSDSIPTSALTSKDKYAAMKRCRDAVRLSKGEVLAHVSADASRWGNNFMMAAFYAVFRAMLPDTPAVVLIKATLMRTAAKLVRPPDILFRSTAVQNLAVAETTTGREAAASPVYAIKVPHGMLQGIFQDASNLLGSVALAHFDAVAATLGVSARSVGTSDDSYTAFSSPTAGGYERARMVRGLRESTMRVFGILTNPSKTIVSTIYAELNTWVLSHGRTLAQPVAPYIRSALSAGRRALNGTARQAASDAMSAACTTMREGASSATGIVVTALAYVNLYTRFKVISDAVLGRYMTRDPMLLGPPVIAPWVVAAFGPTAAAAATAKLSGDRDPIAGAAMAALMRAATAGAEAEWTVTSVLPAEGVITDIALRTARSKREVRDVRYSTAHAKARPAIMQFGEVTSKAGLFFAAHSSAARDVLEDPYKATSSLEAEATSAFAAENARAIAIFLVATGDRVTAGRATLTMAEAYRALARTAPEITAVFPPAAAELLAGVQESAREAESAMITIAGMRGLQRSAPPVRLTKPVPSQADYSPQQLALLASGLAGGARGAYHQLIALRGGALAVGPVADPEMISNDDWAADMAAARAMVVQLANAGVPPRHTTSSHDPGTNRGAAADMFSSRVVGFFPAWPVSPSAAPARVRDAQAEGYEVLAVAESAARSAAAAALGMVSAAGRLAPIPLAGPVASRADLVRSAADFPGEVTFLGSDKTTLAYVCAGRPQLTISASTIEGLRFPAVFSSTGHGVSVSQAAIPGGVAALRRELRPDGSVVRTCAIFSETFHADSLLVAGREYRVVVDEETSVVHGVASVVGYPPVAAVSTSGFTLPLAAVPLRGASYSGVAAGRYEVPALGQYATPSQAATTLCRYLISAVERSPTLRVAVCDHAFHHGPAAAAAALVDVLMERFASDPAGPAVARASVALWNSLDRAQTALMPTYLMSKGLFSTACRDIDVAAGAFVYWDSLSIWEACGAGSGPAVEEATRRFPEVELPSSQEAMELGLVDEAVEGTVVPALSEEMKEAVARPGPRIRSFKDVVSEDSVAEFARAMALAVWSSCKQAGISSPATTAAALAELEVYGAHDVVWQIASGMPSQLEMICLTSQLANRAAHDAVAQAMDAEPSEFWVAGVRVVGLDPVPSTGPVVTLSAAAAVRARSAIQAARSLLSGIKRAVRRG